MKNFSRPTYLSAMVTMAFLFFSQYPALADECTQKRKTPKAPSKTYKQTNPLEATPENISAGKILYQKGAKPLACFQCHGTNGSGDGKMARGMKPEPRNFSCKAMMENIPDGQLFWVIKNGSKGTGMMGFKTLNDDQIWQVVSYIRQFSN
ncbi:MAG: c-type cytochrome [Nitrospina sp.]|jgi:mono/diheme cytochrome c family protein|nr:c-type cytochrome [Nitrospina sp.]